MQLLVFMVIGVIALILSVGLDLGGTIGALFMLTFWLIGGVLRAWEPLIAWLRGPAANQ